MVTLTAFPNVENLTAVQRDLLASLTAGAGLDPLAAKLSEIAYAIERQSQAGLLQPDTSAVAFGVAENVKVIAQGVLQLGRASDSSLNGLLTKLDDIVIEDGESSHPPHSIFIQADFPLGVSSKKRRVPSTPLRSSKRPRHPSFPSPSSPVTRDASPSSSDRDSLDDEYDELDSESEYKPILYPNSTVNPKSRTKSKLNSTSKAKSNSKPNTNSKEPDHSLIRLWFLANLSYPYPTVSIKERLALEAGITRSKVDSDLTNFRRRAGWTDLMNAFCGGDRDKMRRLIERVNAGREGREEVLQRVAGIREYLERKEEERVGDWVKEITALAPFAPAITGTPPTTSTTTPASSNTANNAFTKSLSKHTSTASLSSLSGMSEVSSLLPSSRRVGSTTRSASGSSTDSAASASSVEEVEGSYALHSRRDGRKRLNPFAMELTPLKRPSAARSVVETLAQDQTPESSHTQAQARGGTQSFQQTQTRYQQHQQQQPEQQEQDIENQSAYQSTSTTGLLRSTPLAQPQPETLTQASASPSARKSITTSPISSSSLTALHNVPTFPRSGSGTSVPQIPRIATSRQIIVHPGRPVPPPTPTPTYITAQFPSAPRALEGYTFTYPAEFDGAETEHEFEDQYEDLAQLAQCDPAEYEHEGETQYQQALQAAELSQPGAQSSTHTSAHRQPQAQVQAPAHTQRASDAGSSIWSSSTALPLLPHVSLSAISTTRHKNVSGNRSTSASAWSIPQCHTFEPRFDGWMSDSSFAASTSASTLGGRSVSNISRAL